MNYFIISDTHFWHDFMIDIWIRKKWFEEKILRQLSLLPKDTILIHLWDICIGRDTYRHEVLSQISLRKILVKGNHDKKTYSRYLEHWWDFVCDTFTLDLFNKKIIFSHEPICDHWYDINIHWHMHVKFDRNIGRENEWRCYSAEIESYVPKKLTHEFLHSITI